MILQSKIFRGEVVHERLEPVAHTFRYPVTFFAFDLGELPRLAEHFSFFGYNDARPLRISDGDYLFGHRNESVFEQLQAFLGREKANERTVLVTSPRYFGYAFNPVNFHLRLRGEQLLGVVAEVNNTFGDRHVYPLRELKHSGKNWTARCPKEFHVSPFNDLSGEYRFTFKVEDGRLWLGVDLHKEGHCVMKTWLRGQGEPITRARLWRHVCLHPLDTALNSMPRILWQAAVLHYKRRLSSFKRPAPHSPETLIDRDRPEPNRPVV